MACEQVFVNSGTLSTRCIHMVNLLSVYKQLLQNVKSIENTHTHIHLINNLTNAISTLHHNI